MAEAGPPGGRPVGPLRAIGAGVAVGVVVAVWLSLLTAAYDERCSSQAVFGCSGDALEVLLIGLPLVVVGTYLALRLGGARLPSVGVLCLAAVVVAAGRLIGSLEPPVFVWPVGVGAFATIYVALSRR